MLWVGALCPGQLKLLVFDDLGMSLNNQLYFSRKMNIADIMGKPSSVEKEHKTVLHTVIFSLVLTEG